MHPAELEALKYIKKRKEPLVSTQTPVIPLKAGTPEKGRTTRWLGAIKLQSRQEKLWPI